MDAGSRSVKIWSRVDVSPKSVALPAMRACSAQQYVRPARTKWPSALSYQWESSPSGAAAARLRELDGLGRLALAPPPAERVGERVRVHAALGEEVRRRPLGAQGVRAADAPPEPPSSHGRNICKNFAT